MPAQIGRWYTAEVARPPYIARERTLWSGEVLMRCGAID